MLELCSLGICQCVSPQGPVRPSPGPGLLVQESSGYLNLKDSWFMEPLLPTTIQHTTKQMATVGLNGQMERVEAHRTVAISGAKSGSVASKEIHRFVLACRGRSRGLASVVTVAFSRRAVTRRCLTVAAAAGCACTQPRIVHRNQIG